MNPISEITIAEGKSEDNREEAILRSLEYPLNGEARALARDLVESVAEMVAQAVTRFKQEGLEQARATLVRVRAERAAMLERATASEAAWARSVPGSLGCALLMAPFALSCLAMEFVISWTALSWLFGVSRDSLLGVMLGVGPTAALAVLKVIFARLFEQPYQALRDSSHRSPLARLITQTAMGVFLVAVASFNLYTTTVQAKVREKVLTVARVMLENNDVTTFEPVQSEAAVVATSLAVSLNGAILLVIAWNEAHNWRRCRSAKKAARADQDRVRDLETVVAKATADASARTHEDVGSAAKVAGDRRRAELLLLLHGEESRQAQARTAVQSVTRRLRMVTA